MPSNSNKNGDGKAVTVYGERDEVRELAFRVGQFMPGGASLSERERLMVAQYALAVDANPYRGEVYVIPTRQGPRVVDGYKLLVRWAKSECGYSEKYDALPADELPEGAIGYRCWILRNDSLAMLNSLTSAGMDGRDAFEIVATSAVGIVTKGDRTDKKGCEMDPPKSWSWEQVAQKRALKNALRFSHGSPSPSELAKMHWLVDDVETKPEDWEDVTPDMSSFEREELAKLSATTREALERIAALSEEERSELLNRHQEVMHGSEEELNGEII